MRKDILEAIAKDFGITLVYLFGSQAETGRSYLEGKEILPDLYSDLDVAVAFEEVPAQTMKVYGRLFKEISDLFAPFGIDLVLMHEVDSLFQYEIIKGTRIYEGDETAADAFEERILKKAGDLILKKKSLNREIMEAMENGYFEFEYIPNP